MKARNGWLHDGDDCLVGGDDISDMPWRRDAKDLAGDRSRYRVDMPDPRFAFIVDRHFHGASRSGREINGNWLWPQEPGQPGADDRNTKEPGRSLCPIGRHDVSLSF
jgi:hypothetical protein